jgi:MFS family permease
MPDSADHMKLSSRADDVPWWREVTRYQWFVFVVASLGWLFDTMDQQLFNLARMPAITELWQASAAFDPKVWGGVATTVFMVGWATGGIIFGILGDRIGRVKTMLITIVVYSLFTGLSAAARNVYDFSFYRFLTGLGVGGEFAVGVALVAEVMPDHARPHALGWLQACSAIGNIVAGSISFLLGYLASWGTIVSAWRIMFFIGMAPALLAALAIRHLKEPDRWRAVASAEQTGKRLGSLKELFGSPIWRQRTIVGILLASSGVIGLWGIVFFVFELVRYVLGEKLAADGLTSTLIEGKLTSWVGLTSLLLNAGGFFGVYTFSRVTNRIGRKPAFLFGLLVAPAGTAFTFWFFDRFIDVFWMIPLMGFCVLTLFGGYAIYFPELFPTRLRSTGTSFCYNVGRYVAAPGPFILGLLASHVFASYGTIMSYRYAGVTMCACFLIGLAALPFAPETRGQPLPE